MIGLLLPWLVPSVMLLAAVWMASSRPRPFRSLFGILFVAFLLGCLMISKILLLQVAFTAVLLVLFAGMGGKTRSRRFVAVAAACAAFGIVINDALHEARRLAVLRAEFPLQPVSDRLAYETKRTPQNVAESQFEASATAAVAIQLAPEVESNLQDSESRGQYTHRGASLARLHRTASDRQAATLLGGSRMSTFVNTVIALPESRSISLSEPPPQSGCSHPKPTPTPEYTPKPSPSESSTPFYALREFHDQGARDFLNPERFGHVQDREHVAGFEPHAFQSMPALGTNKSPVGDWSLEHLDLVSMLKPTGPHVYVTANLPKADELKTADTRLLDDFETRALAQLRTDQDVVIEESDGVVRMVGALRAGNQCLRCHSARRGELIGAFSYELHRKLPAGHQTAQVDGPPET